MRKANFLLSLLGVFFLYGEVQAIGPFRGARRTVYQTAPASYSQSNGFSANNSSAQGVADYMARTGRLQHIGGNSGYEGVGMASTPEAAEWACCYRRQMKPREVGVAQGANGYWYACCRY
jgi:hypothetical protein